MIWFLEHVTGMPAVFYNHADTSSAGVDGGEIMDGGGDDVEELIRVPSEISDYPMLGCGNSAIFFYAKLFIGLVLGAGMNGNLVFLSGEDCFYRSIGPSGNNGCQCGYLLWRLTAVATNSVNCYKPYTGLRDTQAA